jgi:hypothetical protein
MGYEIKACCDPTDACEFLILFKLYGVNAFKEPLQKFVPIL